VNWNKYNESHVKRGEILVDFDVIIDNWHIELDDMNEGKKGRIFVYPDSFKITWLYERILSFTIQTN
jgi:hypothetical protein